jgi:hypothetical protein
MRFVKQFAGLAVVLGMAALAGRASAFTAPTNLAPYLPAANLVTVAKINSNVSGVDQYTCNPAAPGLTVLSVTAGTPLSQVQKLASSNLAFYKFKLATLTAAQRANALQVQAATVWFMNNIGRPLYGL